MCKGQAFRARQSYSRQPYRTLIAPATSVFEGRFDQALRPRRQQAEVTHGVLVPIQDMLREDGNKLRRRSAGFQRDFRSGVFTLVNDFEIRPIPDDSLTMKHEAHVRNLRGSATVPYESLLDPS